MYKRLTSLLLVISLFFISSSCSFPSKTKDTESPSDISTTKAIETIKGSTNGIDYSIPANWSIDTRKESDRLTFYIINENEFDNVLVIYDTISPIMKIETGNGNSMQTKEDVAGDLTNSGLFDFDTVKSSAWKMLNGYECFVRTFNENEKNISSKVGERVGKSIIIPINENEAYFTITIRCIKDDAKYLDDIYTVINSVVL